MKGNTIAIIGRPNVGKSTLFNRIVGERKAIVDDTSGVTRDRIYGVGEWNGKKFNVIDTGGFVQNSDDIFELEIKKQVKLAMNESNILLFTVDVTVGITDLEEEIASMLRKADNSKVVLLVVNKVDNNQRLLDSNEFYSLGFEKLFPLSSINGSGTGELLDEIVSHIDEPQQDSDESIPKIAIVGQPNVGKSSMLNILLGEDRNIVTDIAGTTRDTIHTRYKLFGKDFILIDTAGIRKKSKVEEDLEFYSVIRAVKALEEADIVLLMIDAQMGIEAQDLKILSMVEKKGKGLVIVVNKWDLIEKDQNTILEFEKKIKERISPFTDVPIIFTSVVNKLRIFKVIEAAVEVYENKMRKVTTSALNNLLEKATAELHPPSYRGKIIQIKYATQLPTKTPAFAFFCNYPDEVQVSYRNYLEKKIRSQFNFSGIPIRIYFRKK